MGKFIGSHLIGNSDSSVFKKELDDILFKYEKEDIDVKVHYSTSILGNHVVQSALIILRKL